MKKMQFKYDSALTLGIDEVTNSKAKEGVL